MPVRSTRPTGLRRVATAALVAALASGTVLLLGRLGGGSSPGWGLAGGLFALLLGVQLLGPGPARVRPPAGPRPGPDWHRDARGR